MRVPQRGFGLLEAIVALTILALTGAALYTWMGSNLRAMSQLAETRARARLQLQGLEVLEAVNPASQPKGTRRLGQVEMNWRSELVSPVRPGISRGDSVRWQIGLYRVYVQLRDTEAGLETSFNTLHTGLLPIVPLAPAAAPDKS